jgi:hypothetical protein
MERETEIKILGSLRVHGGMSHQKAAAAMDHRIFRFVVSDNVRGRVGSISAPLRVNGLLAKELVCGC